MASEDGRDDPGGAGGDDPLGTAIAAFLTDLLDNVVVEVHTDVEPDPDDQVRLLPATPARGADGRSRQFAMRSTVAAARALDPAGAFPPELADLPDAALRALGRMAHTPPQGGRMHPSLARALHDIVVAEVLSDRLLSRIGPGADLDAVVRTVAETLDYALELASTQVEGRPVAHGVVLCTDLCGLTPLRPPVAYPGRLPSRKRTPLLFDGTESVLAVTATGEVLCGVDRGSLPRPEGTTPPLSLFDDFPGVSGALTAAASAVFRGVGVYLRADRSIWVFDEGEPLFVRRTTRWKSIAIGSFARWLATFGGASSGVADVLARAVLRASMQGTGGIFALAPDASVLADLVAAKDLVHSTPATGRERTVDEDLHVLIAGSELGTAAALARLARLDGATIIDPSGSLLAYGAIVRSADSRGEGARTAAARTLSLRAALTVSVSQDGPVQVFHQGEAVLDLL